MTERTRTFSWDDPKAIAQHAMTMTGLEFIQAMIAGEIPPPPITQLMNFTLGEAREGMAAFVGDPAEYHYNPIGAVHGGFAATLLDSALGCAVHTTLPAGTGYTTLEIKVNYIRPITGESGPMRAEANVIHSGRRTAIAEAKLTDEQGKLYAHATTTCMVFTPGV